MGQLLGISENQERGHMSLAQQVNVPVSGGLSLAKIHDLTVQNEIITSPAYVTSGFKQVQKWPETIKMVQVGNEAETWNMKSQPRISVSSNRNTTEIAA